MTAPYRSLALPFAGAPVLTAGCSGFPVGGAGPSDVATPTADDLKDGDAGGVDIER